MNTEEVKQHIEDSNETIDAYDLLTDAVPSAARRFYKLEADMAKLLAEVRKHYPDAMYYTSGGDGFALLLGQSHGGKGDSPNNELIAISAVKLTVEGGDW